MADALGTNSDWKLPLLKGVSLWPKISSRRGRPPSTVLRVAKLEAFMCCYCIESESLVLLTDVCRELLKLFITPEIMRWSNVCATYEKELRTGSGAGVFTSESESGNKRWDDLKIRTVEHVC